MDKEYAFYGWESALCRPAKEGSAGAADAVGIDGSGGAGADTSERLAAGSPVSVDTASADENAGLSSGTFAGEPGGTWPGIETPRDLYDVLCDVWQADTCAPRMRDRWTKENKTLGQCSVTAFLVQDIFGGEVRGIRRSGGNFHCFNVVGQAQFDLTSEQFGDEKLDYGTYQVQSREVHFAKAEKYARYQLLRRRVVEALAAR